MGPIYYIFIALPCTVGAIALALIHIYRHLLNYTEPTYQRFIVRIIFMVPVSQSSIILIMLQRCQSFNPSNMYDYLIYAVQLFFFHISSSTNQLTHFLYFFVACCLPFDGLKHIFVFSLQSFLVSLTFCETQYCLFYGSNNFHP